MAEKVVEGPFTAPYLVQCPPPPLDRVLTKFEGRRTPKTFAAAKRIQKAGVLRIPRNLLNTLYRITGGWKEIKSTFYSGFASNSKFPIVKMSECQMGQQVGSDPQRPWRNAAYGMTIGELGICLISTNMGPEGFLRWRGWIIGHIDDRVYTQGSNSVQNWADETRVREVIKNMCHKLSDQEADEWGFFRAGDLTKEQEREKREREERERRNRR